MLREFTDAAGKTWRVWDVYPSTKSKSSMGGPSAEDAAQLIAAFPHRDLSEGWLCFECGSEKRRLAPIPPEWEIGAAALLEELCRRAGYITQSRDESSTS